MCLLLEHINAMYYLNDNVLQKILVGIAGVIFILLQKLTLVQSFSYEDRCDKRLKFLLKYLFPRLYLREILFSLLRNMIFSSVCALGRKTSGT